MADDLLSLLGGIGLFLFGMQTMTVALRELAGRRTRAVIARFTRTPLTGFLTGVATTAAVQSSSATIMTTIGFVGAGLMTFPQALGVIFGANVGSTVTGWMVAILGLKLDLGMISLPLLFAASLAASLTRGRWAVVARAVAGFSLVFLGLDLMQRGTGAVAPILDLAPDFGDGPGELLLLIVAGFAVTAVIQSSGAGVAAALVLLNDGLLSLVAAGALVIGMDLGTTLKSVVATLGGSTGMRRTAVAHVGYNLVTALLAVPLLAALPLISRVFGGDEPTALVAFHTLFNLSGVLVFLPFADRCAQLIERIVPARGGMLPEALDSALLAEPDAAVEAARISAGRLAGAVAESLSLGLRGQTPRPRLRTSTAGSTTSRLSCSTSRFRQPTRRSSRVMPRSSTWRTTFTAPCIARSRSHDWRPSGRNVSSRGRRGSSRLRSTRCRGGPSMRCWRRGCRASMRSWPGGRCGSGAACSCASTRALSPRHPSSRSRMR